MKKFLLLALALFATGLSIAQTPEFEKQSQAISEQVRDGRPLVLNTASNSKPDYVITDAAWFWQSPYGK